MSRYFQRLIERIDGEEPRHPVLTPVSSPTPPTPSVADPFEARDLDGAAEWQVPITQAEDRGSASHEGERLESEPHSTTSSRPRGRHHDESNRENSSRVDFTAEDQPEGSWKVDTRQQARPAGPELSEAPIASPHQVHPGSGTAGSDDRDGEPPNQPNPRPTQGLGGLNDSSVDPVSVKRPPEEGKEPSRPPERAARGVAEISPVQNPYEVRVDQAGAATDPLNQGYDSARQIDPPADWGRDSHRDTEPPQEATRLDSGFRGRWRSIEPDESVAPPREVTPERDRPGLVIDSLTVEMASPPAVETGPLRRRSKKRTPRSRASLPAAGHRVHSNLRFGLGQM